MRNLPSTVPIFGKRVAASHYCAGGVAARSRAQLPIIDIRVDGEEVRALVDTGCSTTMIEQRLINSVNVSIISEKIQTVGGPREIRKGAWANIEVRGQQIQCWTLLTTDLSGIGVGVLLGMDVIAMLGGVTVNGNGTQLAFGIEQVSRNMNCGQNQCGSQDERAEILATVKRSEASRGAMMDPTGSLTPPAIITDQNFTTKFNGQCWSMSWH